MLRGFPGREDLDFHSAIDSYDETFPLIGVDSAQNERFESEDMSGRERTSHCVAVCSHYEEEICRAPTVSCG